MAVNKRAPTAKIGKAFEQEISRILELKGFTVLRLPDGCRQLGQFKIIRVKNQFDFIAHKPGEVIFFDAKNTEEKNFPHSKINQDQLEHLLGLELNGFKAGYIINFKQEGKALFAPAGVLKTIVKGKSLSPLNCDPL